MVISRRQNFYTNQLYYNEAVIERVRSFKYLGCWLDEKWDCEKEIRCRIEIARSCFFKLRKILSNTCINLKLRIRFMKCYVWSTLLYGVEAWTLKTYHMNLLESFEMWCYRRILKIPWTARVTNEDVLKRIGKTRELLKAIKKRKTAYLGHVIRGDKYNILQLILEGKIEGKRGIGRKQLSWLRNIRHWTGLQTIGSLINTARNREAFTHIINNIN